MAKNLLNIKRAVDRRNFILNGGPGAAARKGGGSGMEHYNAARREHAQGMNKNTEASRLERANPDNPDIKGLRGAAARHFQAAHDHATQAIAKGIGIADSFLKK